MSSSRSPAIVSTILRACAVVSLVLAPLSCVATPEPVSIQRVKLTSGGESCLFGERQWRCDDLLKQLTRRPRYFRLDSAFLVLADATVGNAQRLGFVRGLQSAGVRGRIVYEPLLNASD